MPAAHSRQFPRAALPCRWLTLAPTQLITAKERAGIDVEQCKAEVTSCFSSRKPCGDLGVSEWGYQLPVIRIQGRNSCPVCFRIGMSNNHFIELLMQSVPLLQGSLGNEISQCRPVIRFIP